MTDYELIVKCKEGSQKAYIDLFSKYRGFLKKKYSGFKKRCPTDIIEFADFENEAYIWFMKAVKYVDLSRLTNPETWRFLTPYIWFINNMITKLVQNQADSCFEISISTPVHSNNYGNVIEMIELLSKEGEFDSSPEKSTIQTVMIEEFISMLTPYEKELVDVLKKSPERQKTLIVKSAAAEMGCSKQWLYLQISKIRKKFIEATTCYA